MPKARSIREGFDDDQRIALLSCGAELLFRKMIHKADDHGRVQAHPTTLLRWYAGKPDQPDETALAAALDELEDLTIIRRYARGGLSYALIPGWFDKGCPWYQHITKRAEPLYPGPDDPEDTQTELPFGQRGARREPREERRQAIAGGADQRDAGAAAPHDERGHRVEGSDPAGGGERADACGAGAGQRGADAAREAAGEDDGARRAGRAAGDVDRAGERAGRDGAGPEEPAQGRVSELADDGIAAPRVPDPNAPGTGAPGWGRGGSSPPPPTTPPAAPEGLPAPLALRIFAEGAGERWAPGLAAATATGLPHKHEADWLRVWGEARAAGYGEPQLRQLGAALREGRLWRNRPPLSPGKLTQHLHDLLAEACAPPGPTQPPRPAAPERGGTGDPLPRAVEPCGEDFCDGQLHYDADPQQVRPRPKRSWICPKRPA